MEIVTIKEAKETVSLIVDSEIDTSAMFWGPPGVGKSEVFEQVAKERQWGFIDIRLLMYNPVDLRGIPYPNENKTKANWLSPDNLPYEDRDGKRGILLLDELPNAHQSVQTAAYQLIHNKCIGEYKLPKGWFIFAAGNRKEDKAGVQDMPAPLKNRMVHLEINPDFDVWKEWAYANNVEPNIISFLQYRSDLFYSFDPKVKSPSFPTPRTWKFASDAMVKTKRSLNNKLLFNIVSGVVGEGPASELKTFIDVERSLPNIDKIVNGSYSKSDVPTQVDVTYMLIGKLVHTAKKLFEGINRVEDVTDDAISGLDNIVKYITNELNEDFAVLGCKDILRLHKDVMREVMLRKLKSDSWVKFLQKNAYLFRD